MFLQNYSRETMKFGLVLLFGNTEHCCAGHYLFSCFSHCMCLSVSVGLYRCIFDSLGLKPPNESFFFSPFTDNILIEERWQKSILL